jgi:ribonuclease HI
MLRSSLQKTEVEKLWLVDEIYTDGGVVLKNPSMIGGTYGFVLVSHQLPSLGSDGREIYAGNGFVPRYDERPVTNNWMEQIAIIKALEMMPEGWSGKICSDSDIALGRVFGRYTRMNNLPPNIINRTKEVLSRLGKLEHELVAGHPTKIDLSRSYKIKNGIKWRVSKWNVLADKLCNEAKSEAENYIFTV